MKKYIIFLLLILILPLNVQAFEKATDTTHESYLLPYYTNIFNDYNYLRYVQALEIINNSPKYSNSSKTYKYDYIVVKKQDKYTTIIRVQSNQEYLNLDYSKSSNNYSFSINKKDTSVPSTAIYIETMQLNASTTDTTFKGTSTNGYVFFTHYNGYSTSGWNGSMLVNQSDILYSTIDIKLGGNNIYNGNLLRKIVTYGTPYNYIDYSALDSTGRQEYYKNMTFQNYAKSTTTLLKSGDTFYSHDLEGTKYSFSSETYKNATIDIITTSVSMGTTFKLQFKTDNTSAKPPILYGLNDDKYTFISYMNYDYDKFLTSSKIYEIGNNQLCINGICRTIGDFSSYQIRYNLENTNQNVTFIYNGSRSIVTSYDLEGFEYIAPDKDGNFPSGGGSITDNGWFDRTEDYFNSLGDMELLEKLNPIYWLKGLGMILLDLFVPTDEFFENYQKDTIEKLTNNFDITSIINIANQLKDLLDVTNNEVPVYTMDFSFMNIEGFTTVNFDFSWYVKYRPIVHNFIIATLLVNTLFWLIRKVSGLLS